MREPTMVAMEGNATSALSPSPPQPPPQALLERLKDYGQEDVFALWDELSPDERDFLVRDIEVFPFAFYSYLSLVLNLFQFCFPVLLEKILSGGGKFYSTAEQILINISNVVWQVSF